MSELKGVKGIKISHFSVWLIKQGNDPISNILDAHPISAEFDRYNCSESIQEYAVSARNKLKTDYVPDLKSAYQLLEIGESLSYSGAVKITNLLEYFSS